MLSDARRQPRREREPADLERGERGVLARLEHAGVAHGERRADAAPEDLHRVVPRDDVAGDAVRLAQGQDRVAGVVGDRGAVHLVGRAAVELEVARQRQRVGLGLAERLADVLRLEPGELVRLLEHQLAEPDEDAAALERRHPAPVAIERRARRRDRRIDVRRGAAGELGEARAVARIDDRDGGAAARLAPVAVDQDLPFEHRAPASVAAPPDPSWPAAGRALLVVRRRRRQAGSPRRGRCAQPGDGRHLRSVWRRCSDPRHRRPGRPAGRRSEARTRPDHRPP